MACDDQAFGRIGAERHQHAIEADLFLRLGRGLDIGNVERADLAEAVDLALIIEADIADELHGHGYAPAEMEG